MGPGRQAIGKEGKSGEGGSEVGEELEKGECKISAAPVIEKQKGLLQAVCLTVSRSKK